MNPVPLRERNRQRIRQRIIAAAAELFHDSGYSQTTMDDIAQKAEISRATLFNYFRTKDALLIPFGVEIFQRQIQPQLTAYLDSQPPTLDAFRFLFMNIHEHVFAVPKMDRAIKRAFIQPKTVEHSIPVYDAGLSDSLMEILRYGQQRGEVRTDISLQQQGRYIAALCISVFHALVMQSEDIDYESEVDAMLSFIQSGIQPQ